MITISMPLEPYGKKAPATRIVYPKGNKKPFAVIYTTAESRKYEAEVQKYALAAMGPRQPLEGPLTVLLDAFFAVPSSWSDVKWRKAVSGVIRPTGKPDCDNISKICSDGCNGIVWVDDSQIVDLRVRKFYAKQPSIKITVRNTEIGLLERDEDAA